VETVTHDWAKVGVKDPAEANLMQRLVSLADSVVGAGYRSDIESTWTERADQLRTAYDNRGG
jgi:hypothetical protein